jgi:TolB-like protein
VAREPELHSVETPVSLGRLDSWKEIATYLKRDVRTVQRWEKMEKLPVRRHLHEKQGTVYAFKSEIDAWSQGRQLVDEGEDIGDGEYTVEVEEQSLPPDLQPEPIGHFRVRRFFSAKMIWSLTVLGVAAVGAVGAHLLWPVHQNLVLAVLPFKNLGGVDQQAMVDGFTTETKTRLEQLQPEKMGVLLLTKRYAELPVDKVAAEFNSSYVLQGEAKITGQKVSISARLSRIATRGITAVWNDQYEGDLQDIQQIQSEVSAAIAKAVLSQIPDARPAEKINTEAYEA